jgi:hypothetical protein
VARVVEEAGGLALELRGELQDGSLHGVSAGILRRDDLEAERRESRAHSAGIVDCVAKRRVGVSAVTDNERHARCIALLGKRRRGQEAGEQDAIEGQDAR